MITIITGSINSGKTSTLSDIYQNMRYGDGFISRKVFEHDIHTGYEAVHLKTDNTCTLCMKREFCPDDWDECLTQGYYSFSEKGFDFCNRILDNITRSDENAVFIDEIGPIELEGSGFYKELVSIIKSDIDCWITVRKSLLGDIIEKFTIKNPKIIETGGKI